MLHFSSAVFAVGAMTAGTLLLVALTAVSIPKTVAAIAPELVLSRFGDVARFDVEIFFPENATEERRSHEDSAFSYQRQILDGTREGSEPNCTASARLRQFAARRPKLLMFLVRGVQEVRRALLRLSASYASCPGTVVPGYFYPENVILFQFRQETYNSHDSVYSELNSDAKIQEHKRFALLLDLKSLHVQRYDAFQDKWSVVKTFSSSGDISGKISELFFDFEMRVFYSKEQCAKLDIEGRKNFSGLHFANRLSSLLLHAPS